jgi:hypothetical protein
MAPLDKVNRVILQKWNSIGPAKQEAYIRRTLRKMELQKQQQLVQPKQQEAVVQEEQPAEQE